MAAVFFSSVARASAVRPRSSTASLLAPLASSAEMKSPGRGSIGPPSAAIMSAVLPLGSAMFGSNPSHPESIGIRMGTFDADPGIRPTVRQFVAFAAPWEPIPDDGLPRFPESRHAPGSKPPVR